MSVSQFFLDDKYLKSILPDYVLRNTQIEMAEIIESALNSYTNTFIEAPTGSGKTMAYLIPSFAGDNKIILSTKTKQLMNQLLYKDIPVVQKIIGSKKSVRSLKGRKNYFCPHRYYKFVHSKAAFYIDAVSWFEEMSKYGDIIEAPWGVLDNDVCSLMTADRFQCIGNKCAYYDECPFYMQKKEANIADIMVTNHFLLLSDIAMKSKESFGSIFEYRDNIIFDEAHSVPDIFSQYAGVEFPLSSLMILFYENKDIIKTENVDKVYKAYSKILDKIKEPKILYEPLADDFKKLMELASSIILSTDDEEIKEEFGVYLLLYEEFNCDKEGVRLIEKTIQKNTVYITLKFIPFESGTDFVKGLKDAATSSVFVSATLSSGGDFAYIIKETGMQDMCETYILDNVFDFNAQGKLFAPKVYNSENDKKNKIYLELLTQMEGSALIICNSLERMQFIEKLLRSAEINKKIYTQVGVNIGELDFCSEDMVLIGSATLREGIDISGGGFKAVILDQLPFEYPKDILLQSKAEKLSGENANSFIDFFLPRAVLYFKQAVGRLIRHEDDFGIWVVLDYRIIDKSYGKYFLDVISNVEIVENIEDALYFIKEDIHG